MSEPERLNKILPGVITTIAGLTICEECHAAVWAEALALHEERHELTWNAVARLKGRVRQLDGEDGAA